MTPHAGAAGWRRGLTITLLCSLLALLYLTLIAKGELEIELQTSTSTRLRVFWSDNGQHYSERRSSKIDTDTATYRYLLTIGDLGSIHRLRIDPAEVAGRVVIRRIEIRQPGYAPLRLESPAELARLRALHQVEVLEVGRHGIAVATNGQDPQLELVVAPQRVPMTAAQWAPLLLLLAGGVLVLLLEPRYGREYRYVPYGLTCACALALVMASLSPNNAHPDEQMHVLAARYYEDHWQAPQICAPEILESYSPYGHSRLHNLEVAYLLAGKWSRVLKVIPGLSDAPYWRLRLFNLFLFLLLLGVSLREPDSRLLLLPLLLTAQVWYIFSYFNSDAFALVMICLGALQLVRPESRLRRLLTADAGSRWCRDALAMGLLLALLLLIKKNFYAIHLLMALGLAAVMMRVAPARRRQALGRAALLLLVTAGWLAPFLASEFNANGLDRKTRLRACREQMAATEFKAATPLESQHWTLNWRQRGISLKEMLVQRRWGEQVFRSSVGVYGYLTVAAPQLFYDCTAVVMACFLTYVAVFGWLTASAAQRGWGAVVALLAAGSIAGTMWHAWTRDFQVQGRYLLPLLTLIGVWLHGCGPRLDRLVLNGLSFMLMALALYSFAFVALPGILRCV